MSVIPVSFFPDFKRSSEFSLSAANNSEIEVYGSQLLKLSLNLRREFCHPFYVASISKPIIGADFLTKYNLTVDLANRRLIDPLAEIHSDAVE